MSDSKGSVGSIFAAFLAGGIVGAGLALLFAPASGREARSKIVETTTGVKGKALEKVEIARETLADMTEEIKSTVKAAVEAAIEAGKEGYAKTKQEIKKEAEEA